MSEEEDDDGLQEVIDEFVAESYEGLDQIDNDLVVLEADPEASEVLARVFRALHTIKGTCSFLDFGILESVSHSAETLLSKMRDGSIVADATIISTLLEASDAIRAMLEHIEAEGHDRVADCSSLEARLNGLAAGEEVAPAEAPLAATVEAPPAATAEAPPTTTAEAPDAVKEKPASVPTEASSPSVVPDDDDDDDGFGEIIKEFLAESYEGLEQVDQDLVVLESVPGSREVLDRVFRTIHTIKGTCSFLDFPKLEWLSHAGENLLSRLRDGTLVANKENIEALLELADAQREILASIEAGGSEGLGEYGSLADRLNDLAESEAAAEGDSPATESATAPLMPTPAEAALEAAKATVGATKTSTTERTSGSASPGKRNAAPRSASPEPQIAESSIRVDVNLLDQLMNLVGELVLARNRVLEFGPVHDNRSYNTTIQQLNHITSELQGGVMKTRMQPIGDVWKKFPRLVRDLTRAFGKKAQLEMVGAETDLDRSLLQAIRDPLTHVIRNAVDHGIELPAVRVASGKPEHGTVMLKAYHQGGQVIIEVVDDGAGMNVARVRERAVERELAPPDVVRAMSDREVSNLIFLPGFSTAEKVTAVSGRGVGMDVVKTNIEKVGGSIDFQNRPGHGTTMRFRIPLTLAIVPALFIWAKGELYAIPQTSLLELVRTRSGSGAEGIEFIHGTPVFRLRGRLLPVVFLNKELELDLRSPEEIATGGQFNIVVLRTENQDIGLVVDEIQNTGEIVVKPLGSSLEDLGVFAGATITGSGQVALILDVARLAERAGVVSDTAEVRSPTSTLDRLKKEERSEEMLLLRGRDSGRMALPLSKLERLEEFRRDDVQFTGNRMVVKYRGGVLPLIEVSELLEERRGVLREDGASASLAGIQAVICTSGDHEIGLITDRVLDIVRVSTSNVAGSTRTGVLGTIVINDSITELLDVDLLLGKARDLGLDLAESSLRLPRT
jgi:two-component system, chemotaxis family, sensor kinase CheA